MQSIIHKLNYTTVILLTLSAMLLAGFLLTRLTKLAKLPNVTGYIIAGILIGPHVFKLIPVELIDKMGFVSDIALAFIAFAVGRYLNKEAFRQTGKGILIITFFEAVAAGILVTLSMRFIFGLSWNFSLLLGAIATATAPASTMATIRQYGARGKFVNTLLQVVVFDDVICLVLFSIVAAAIRASSSGTISFISIMLPIIYNIGAIGVGFLCGIILSRLMTVKRSEDNRLILTIALLLGIAGLCATLHISPLLACMVYGMTYINTKKDNELYNQIEKFTPPIMSIFFVLSGMNLDITAFKTLGIIGVVYFVIRIVGKYFGAYAGCALAGTKKNIRDNLGLALIPQAGVAIGLAFLGQRLLPTSLGNDLLTIILSSSVLYELIGPVSAKFALMRSGAIKQIKPEPPAEPPAAPPDGLPTEPQT